MLQTIWKFALYWVMGSCIKWSRNPRCTSQYWDCTPNLRFCRTTAHSQDCVLTCAFL